jgi:threonine dehydratase
MFKIAIVKYIKSVNLLENLIVAKKFHEKREAKKHIFLKLGAGGWMAGSRAYLRQSKKELKTWIKEVK